MKNGFAKKTAQAQQYSFEKRHCKTNQKQNNTGTAVSSRRTVLQQKEKTQAQQYVVEKRICLETAQAHEYILEKGTCKETAQAQQDCLE